MGEATAAERSVENNGGGGGGEQAHAGQTK